LDKLTTLAPIKNLEDTIKSGELVNQHGGLDEVAAMLKKLKEGQGKPPCVVQGDKKTPKSIAIFSASDDSIRLISWQPEFTALANELGKGELMADTQWGLKNFVSSWYKVITLHPECRYTVTLQENTRFVEPRDRVQSIFYAQIRR
jgi:hypothetical protein